MIELDVDLVKEIVEKNDRLDGRKFDEYREVVIEPGIVSSAEGSARVKLGDTMLVVGVKLQIGEPFPDTPNEGVLIVSAELVPLASPEFESGPPGEQAIELARVVDRAISESKCIDFKKLFIEEGKVWMVFVDIDVLDHDGNLIDAAGIAAAAALINARIPQIENDKAVSDKKGTEGLPLNGTPISTTFVKIGSNILVDPNLAEFKALDARLTVGTIDIGGKIKACSMQKGGSSGFTIDEIEKILEMAEKKGEELRKKIA